jgi:hypothetical protein
LAARHIHADLRRRDARADAQRRQFAGADDESDVGFSIGVGLRDGLAHVGGRRDWIVALGIVSDIEDRPGHCLVSISKPGGLFGPRLGHGYRFQFDQ